ncbi:helix-turn-helix domain-containing protein [Budviciaceae bacterium BWR-B9]|uniref:Helix-turn-helix domain-containing protein n=1 Tax=Limnobaculum allomyrinae TaxID=2791986 RepID=A0ABS1IMZ8_9GAMM|nr:MULTISPECIES: helix-turn-helix domain-containing protein [Limnobaculum]MBK5142891.1 helix-turn-helix domain-containing protein [Limnobaculum allomyrinae]MBV7690222.1 helix-turn-helix domain-containing protein [Limnobaculum sp. M2-1]
MSDTQGINSVEIAITILEALAEHDKPARAIDIARLSGLSKSRLHKYLVSLSRCDMIYQDPETSLYSLGNKLSVLGTAAQKQNGTLTAINNALSQLRDNLNISTGLAIQKGNLINLVKYNRSNKNIEIDYRDNTPIPLSNSAAGKIFLTYDESYKHEKVLSEEERHQIIQSGYSIRLTETEGIPGARAISCPIFSSSGRLIGAAVMMGFLPDTHKELHPLALQLISAIQEIKL